MQCVLHTSPLLVHPHDAHNECRPCTNSVPKKVTQEDRGFVHDDRYDFFPFNFESKILVVEESLQSFPGGYLVVDAKTMKMNSATCWWHFLNWDILRWYCIGNRVDRAQPMMPHSLYTCTLENFLQSLSALQELMLSHQMQVGSILVFVNPFVRLK